MFEMIMATTNPAIGVPCLCVNHECVCDSASACAFKGVVGSCACYGMS